MNDFKKYFPFYENTVDLVYFDTSATSLKVNQVISAELDYMIKNGTNPHAIDYKKGYEGLQIIEETRELLKQYISASRKEEIVFTSGTTHSINLLAKGLEKIFNESDEILVTELEHSANLLPWIAIANKTKAKVHKLTLNDDFTIDIDSLKKLVNENTKLVTFASVSNTVGSKNNIKLITKVIKKINPNTLVHVDAAQSIGHMRIDVKDLNIDFMSWSAHKMYGPFGVGCLYGKYELLDSLEPLFYGGGMSLKIEQNLVDYTLTSLPEKLEAGTPNISGIVGYKAAIEFVNKIGIDTIEKHELELKKYFIDKIQEKNLNHLIEFYNLHNNAPIVLFNVKGVNPQDITNYLDEKFNIMVRGGANCARRIEGVINTKIAIRASFGINNNKAEIDKFVEALTTVDNFLDALF
ncbi:aminotransferase class V-fold PLP-dependent enzyme [Mesoplasma chauliocola]|uniref:cysteine desulfurase n=1 Tax=Mesoplasma chauliocola TaxID=216427 RepID=A0A249SN31_9MOLU|nr:aminotransferase class V-fold PLP-dependent enzyme [Mesoplasma chauliocola]ASZ09007.1 aminotransferase class V-fold PLP-dependent enzyme [Mesoplasma chauliocola]